MRSVTERSERFSKSACDWHSSVVRISDRAPLVGRKADEQRDLATEELVGPLTRTAGEVGAKGCSMPARGVESRAGVHIRGRKVPVERHGDRRSGCGDGIP